MNHYQNIKMIKCFGLIWLLILYNVSPPVHCHSKPNIVIMMVDDMGWNDVSYHGSDQIRTPNIDSLACFSTILQQYYSQPVCTPARTALLTGVYPLKLGMYGQPLRNSEKRGIPLSEQLLPSYLKQRGYETHLVGKWHVGMFSKLFLPRARGYDTHYGIRGGAVDYYTYILEEFWPSGREFAGFDFFDDDVPQYEEQRYIVQALTDRAVDIIHRHNSSRPLFLHFALNAPHAGNRDVNLQPPLYSPVKNDHIVNPKRRLYAEIISSIDASLGKIIKALFDKVMLENTIILFLSDNGAPTTGRFANWGVNLPFRGIKNTPWEGAVRVPAFIWIPFCKPKIWNGLMHITDLFPTLISAAGGTINKIIDGINQWNSLKNDLKSQRDEVLVAYENKDNATYAAYRAGDYKIIIGNVSTLSKDYYGKDLMVVKGQVPDYYYTLKTSTVAKVFESTGYDLNRVTVANVRRYSKYEMPDLAHSAKLCIPTPERGCLYNIRRDPTESFDLWETQNEIAISLMDKLTIILAKKQERAPFIECSASDTAVGLLDEFLKYIPYLGPLKGKLTLQLASCCECTVVR